MKNFSGLLILPFALFVVSAVLILAQIKVLRDTCSERIGVREDEQR